MTVRQNVGTCLAVVMTWAVVAYHLGMPMLLTAFGGTVVGLAFFFPTVAAISRANRGEDSIQEERNT